MKSQIKITNMPGGAVIDIEGVIGVPEQMQFDEPGDRVATYARFAASLNALKELRVPEVVINIRSTGGDVNDALLIFDALKGMNARITTRCYGYAASAATIIAQAASQGCREISSNALYLIHCSESTAEGNARSLAMTKDLLDKTDMRIASIYAETACRPVGDYIELMNENGGKGRWITAQEAVDAGLADKVTAARVSNGIELTGQEKDDAAELCRLLGLDPPHDLFDPAPHGDADIASLPVLRTLWRTFVKLFGARHSGGRECAADNAANTECRAGAQNSAVPVNEVKMHRAGEDNNGQEVSSDGGISLTGETLPVNKTVVLERQDLQSEALPTVTVPIEDPSIEEPRRTANQEAYEQDVMSMKSSL